MKKRMAILVGLLLLHAAGFSQNLIKGVVVNATNGEPIAGSSVFISNTSRGTVTDKQGNFILTDLPGGKQELVVSSIGFETNVYSFSAEQLPLKLRVEMELKVRELANVTIEPSVEEGWDKWGQTFTESFIGSTPNAAQCRILNRKAIRFRYYRKSNRVIAYADEPIMVENRALGYRISYQMESFEVNFKAGSSGYTGYPLFIDMDKNSRNPKRKWQKARDKAYYGSMMHFMRSVYSDSITENGFEVRRMVRTPNLERERVKQVYRSTVSMGNNVLISVTGNGPMNMKGTDSLATDSSEYYNRILSQKDYIEVYARDILTADSIVVDTAPTAKAIFFPDYLYVTYKKEIEDKAYLYFHREARKPTFQRSYIWLPNKEVIIIDANGSYYPPQELYSMAYWGWDEKMGNMIPLDYQAEE